MFLSVCFASKSKTNQSASIGHAALWLVTVSSCHLSNKSGKIQISQSEPVFQKPQRKLAKTESQLSVTLKSKQNSAQTVQFWYQKFHKYVNIFVGSRLNSIRINFRWSHEPIYKNILRLKKTRETSRNRRNFLMAVVTSREIKNLKANFTNKCALVRQEFCIIATPTPQNHFAVPQSGICTLEFRTRHIKSDALL